MDDFVKNIDRPPQQTDQERALIKRTLTESADLKAEAKRVHGTVQGTVGKFTVWHDGDPTAWGYTEANIDVSAEEFFARLWVQTTYAQKAEHKVRTSESLMPSRLSRCF